MKNLVGPDTYANRPKLMAYLSNAIENIKNKRRARRSKRVMTGIRDVLKQTQKRKDVEACKRRKELGRNLDDIRQTTIDYKIKIPVGYVINEENKSKE